MVYQKQGMLFAEFRDRPPARMIQSSSGRYRLRKGANVGELRVVPGGLMAGRQLFRKRDFGAEAMLRVQAVVKADASKLRSAALSATPPSEPTAAKPSDLVSVKELAPTVRLDIRYASSDNFMGIKLYERPGAYLQRPAAEALARASSRLKARGYGLVIYDGYRPWFVTKMFWDATPAANRNFVADPSKGSRHNRGCAVDLGLVDLRTGAIVEMPGRYDELSRRSGPDYRGGTDRQRWHRQLLREAMEREGFSIYPDEWWHFDYKDWKDYAIGNLSFSQLDLDQAGRR